MVVFITGGLPEFAGWVTIGPKTYAPRFTHDPQFYCKSQVQIAAQPTLEPAHHEAFGHGNNVAAALLQQTFASEH